MTKTRKPILVTGAHRSGSTWAGRVLAMAPRTAYIHEPFNINSEATNLVNWFQYVCEENEFQYQKQLHKIINYYPLGNNLASARTLRNVARIAKSQAISMYYRANNYTPIVKDPLAIFSADWLSKTFDMNVLVMIRHPAAFCSSLKLKGWKHNFSHFLKQPLLMKQYLQKFEADISEFAAREQDIISQAILLWNCIHHTINIYQEKHPEWIFAKHEELSSDPLTEFQKIFDAFNLELTPSAKTYILDSSGAHNPTEQKSGEEFIRNSKANIFNWKNRLTETEIQRIYAGTLEISKLFYAENDWK